MWLGTGTAVVNAGGPKRKSWLMGWSSRDSFDEAADSSRGATVFPSRRSTLTQPAVSEEQVEWLDSDPRMRKVDHV